MSDLQTSHRLLGEEQTEPSPKRRRFSTDTVNDLLFWGFHLCIVAVSLAIVWYKIDKLSTSIRRLLDAQAEEVVLVQRQVVTVEEQTALVKAQEQFRADQVKQNRQALDQMLTSMTEIQTDIRRNLEQTQGIAGTILEVASQTKQASLQAVSASSSAANAAGNAASAATNAASAAGAAARGTNATKALVRSKVVTTEDKIAIEKQQAALAAKKAQLQKEIHQVKKNGPNMFQKIFQ